MLSIGWTLRSKHRQLELSVGGRWFLGFTVALGFAAIYSGNNVIYLLESLMLSSLLVSGVLSELTLMRVRVRREIGNIHAGIPGEDVFVVENLGQLPLYCLELGEFTGRRRELSTFVLMVPGRSTVRVRSRQLVKKRGRHRWDGLLVATSFPFGFARKVRFINEPGSRIIWPAAVDPGRRHKREEYSNRGELDPVADEVIPLESWGDASRLHWPMTIRAGELMARPVRPIELCEEILLELRSPGPEMELAISHAAGSLVHARDAVPPALVLAAKGEKHRILGRARALDALALLPAENGEVAA
jgi:uncharacterized protein (DUF58 family)